MPQRKRILAILTDLALYRKLEELLKRSAFEVDRAPSGTGGLVLLGNMHFDLVLAGAPLPDLGLEQFLAGLRALDSHGRGSPVLLLVPEAHVKTLSDALADEPASVLSVSAEEKEIQNAVSRILGVAARTGRSLLVEIEVEVGDSSQRRLLQTQNLSGSGMLLRGSAGPPIGSRLRLAFSLPGDTHPIRAEAQVVRHARLEVEAVEGFAVHFIDIRDQDRQRLLRFVESERAAANGSDPPREAEGIAHAQR